MDITTLTADTQMAFSKGTAEKMVMLRSSEFPEHAPANSQFFSYTGETASCMAQLDAGYFAACQNQDAEGAIFYKSQY